MCHYDGGSKNSSDLSSTDCLYSSSISIIGDEGSSVRRELARGCWRQSSYYAASGRVRAWCLSIHPDFVTSTRTRRGVVCMCLCVYVVPALETDY